MNFKQFIYALLLICVFFITYQKRELKKEIVILKNKNHNLLKSCTSVSNGIDLGTPYTE